MTKRVVLVTGGSRGIGAAIVRRFRADGWTVAATARRRDSAAASGADLALACDVTDAGQVRAAIDSVLDRFARLDALINNAGTAGANSLEPDADDDRWHETLAVNLTGPYLASKHAGPRLPDGSGRIVNMGSVLSLRGVADQSAYCASKHGLLGLTRAFALHLAARRITVNAICPGWTRSDMATDRWRELGIDEARAASHIPLGRITEAEEVAGVAAFLCGPDAANITGQALTVDGGTLA